MTDFRIDVVIDPSNAAGGARTVEKELIRVENRADRLRVGLLRMLGVLGGGAVLGNAIRTIAQFEQAISTVAAVSGATAEQIDLLKQKTFELGATTRFTATQSAEALTDLARAGFSVNESLSAVGDTLLLAQAGGLGLAEATDIASTTLRGFRLSANQAGRVADVLAEAANATNTSVGELGEGLKFVAPIAAGLNVSLEQTAAAMGLLSDAGLKASLAGTGLRRVLSELESPSQASQKILARLGVTADEVKVSQVGLEQAIRRLGDAGLSTGAALEVFGDRGGPAFEVLSKGIDRLGQLTDRFNTTGGSAQKVADIMDDNLNGALLRLRASYQNLILALSESKLSDALGGPIDTLTRGLQFLAANADTVVRFLQNLALLLGPRFILGALRSIAVLVAANPLGLLLTGLAAAAALIPGLQAQLEGLVQALGSLVSSFAEQFSLQDFLSGFASAIDTIVAFVAGAGAALGVMFDNLATQPAVVGELMKKGFRDAIEATLDFFLAFAQTVGNIILGLGGDVITLVQNVGGAIGAISSGNLDAAQSFADNLESTLSRAGNRVVTFTGQFKNNLAKLRDTEILPEVELTQKARELGGQVADEFGRAFTESTPTAQQSLATLFGNPEDLVAAASALGDELATALRPPLAAPSATIDAMPALSTGAQELLDQIDSVRVLKDVEQQLNEILRQRPDLLEPVKDAYLEAKIAALESSKAAEDGFTRAFLKLQQEAEDFASAAESAVNAFADRATDALVEFAETGEFSFKEFASALLKDITRIIARLLIVQALSAAAGLAGGGDGGAGAAAGAAASGEFAEGGTTQPGRSYLVGENGPELFNPGMTGSVQPLAAAQEPPQVNVQVVNVTDPNEVPQAISSGRADEAILNALSRNPDRVKQVLS